MSLSQQIESLKQQIMSKLPTMLTAASCVGVIGTTVMCAKNTVTAVRVMDEYMEEHPDATNKEKIAKVAPIYIPTALLAASTIAAAIGAHTTSHAQTAAMASAYAIAQEAAKQYREKVREVVGEDKAKEVDEQVADMQLKNNPLSSQAVVIGSGKVLCFDTLSSRYFMSDMETLRKVQNDMNKQLLDDTWVSLNDFYYAIDLDPMNLGEELGWTVDNLLELRFSSRLAEDGQPCLVIDYNSIPHSDFYRKY